ncbi:hypothetical protein D3C76_1296950 [compost metagenome]
MGSDAYCTATVDRLIRHMKDNALQFQRLVERPAAIAGIEGTDFAGGMCRQANHRCQEGQNPLIHVLHASMLLFSGGSSL